MPAGSSTADDSERLVSVTLERSVKRLGQWEYPSWQIVEVTDLSSGAASAAPAPSPAHITWQRVPVVLYKDAVEGYWYNLSGDVPSLFVICCADEEDEDALQLSHVTLNHDEATAHLETDDTVLSIVMPDSLHEWLTTFVAQHHKPEKRKKRKRAEWGEEQHDAERPRARRPVRGR